MYLNNYHSSQSKRVMQMYQRSFIGKISPSYWIVIYPVSKTISALLVACISTINELSKITTNDFVVLETFSYEIYYTVA